MLIKMPLYIESGVKQKKKYHLNLNNYRNLHYQVNNKLKIEYKEILKGIFKEYKFIGKFTKIDIDFTLFRKDKRKGDRSNVLSIHEKFFCDGLVELGMIEDDNDLHINSTHYRTGNIDKDNPRVEIKIKELK
jgi:Holliday junction resolvase RusA-like endonuclease